MTTHDEEAGTFCLVLHSHLPWLAHHGAWPVGEEWLYQAWAASYIPVIDVLNRLAAEGRRNLVTLGVTPVLSAALDDPYSISQFHTWLGFWQERAHGLAAASDPELAELGRYESQLARRTTASFERLWSAGGTPALRPLIDSGAIELLGGPAAHPFQPLLDDEVAAYSLHAGIDDTRLRFGQKPAGIWAPECGYRPGLEDVYSAAGVSHFMVDGPTLLHVGRSTADMWTVGDSDVVTFGRDLDVTYRVWSPKRGYPGGPWYRDFHAFHHESGIRAYRVTSPKIPSEEKAVYDPIAVQAALESDADDFVQLVRQRLLDLKSQRDSKPALVVAGYDTELFGHWWHEGPQWLELVLRKLPEAGVRVTTIADAIDRGAVAGSVRPENSSWGSGKDWSVWAGEPVQSIVKDNDELQRRWRKIASTAASSANRAVTRDPALDQLARDALMALSSDWAFMVTKDSAAAYAWHRHHCHHSDFRKLAGMLEAAYDGDASARVAADRQAVIHGQINNPFGHLDGRGLAAVNYTAGMT